MKIAELGRTHGGRLWSRRIWCWYYDCRVVPAATSSHLAFTNMPLGINPNRDKEHDSPPNPPPPNQQMNGPSRTENGLTKWRCGRPDTWKNVHNGKRLEGEIMRKTNNLYERRWKWTWERATIQRWISKKTERAVRVSSLSFLLRFLYYMYITNYRKA